MTKTYSAYHNDPELKEELIALSDEHIKLDQYRKGAFGKEFDGVFKGCSVG